MPRIVLKPKYKALAKKNVVVDVKPARKMRMRRKNNLKSLANKIAQINSEKKDTGWVASTEIPVAQLQGLTGGVLATSHYATSLAPVPSQGSSSVQRVGDKIQITGMYNRFQFAQQTNALQPTRGRIYFVSPKFSSYSSVVAGASANGIETFLNPNPIILAQSGVNIYDTLCTRNQDYINDWKVLRVVNFTIRGDNVSGQKCVKTVNAGLSFKKKPHIVHFAPGTTTVIAGDIRIFVVFENGNSGAAIVNTTVGTNTNATGVPVKDASSGWTMCYMSKSYFMDV